MSIIHSPKIVTDGLIFYYDMHNTKKSWKGKPTENLYGDFGTSLELRNPNTTSKWDNTGVDVNVGTIWKFTSGALQASWSGNSYGYMYKDIPTENTSVYTGSAYCYVSTDCNISILPISVEITGGYACPNLSSAYDLNKKGTWQRIGISTTGAGSNSRILIYPARYGVTDGSFTGYFQVCGVLFEKSSFPTPFVNGTRTNTQTLLDLTGNNTLTVNSLTYASDNTFSFNGSNRVIASLKMNNNNSTWEAVFKCTEVVNTYNMFMGNFLPYFCFHDGNKLYFSNSVGGVQQTLESPAVLSINNWYHATFTTLQSGANTIASIYLNGKLVQSTTQTGLQSTSVSNFSIGDGQENSWYPFKGNVSLVKIYNRALTESEIKQNFEATRSRYGI